jgi:hypothetical protein
MLAGSFARVRKRTEETGNLSTKGSQACRDQVSIYVIYSDQYAPEFMSVGVSHLMTVAVNQFTTAKARERASPLRGGL